MGMDHKSLLLVFGGRLKELRTARGWTQEELARRARVTADFLGKAERGVKEPSLFVILKLATVFGVAPSYLLSAPPEAGSDLVEISDLLAGRSRAELAWLKEFILFTTTTPVAHVTEPRLPLKYGRAPQERSGRGSPRKRRRRGPVR